MGFFGEFVNKYQSNRKLLLFIVYVALFLDNMLLTTVVPIIPEYLLRMSHPNSTDELLTNNIPTPPAHYITRPKREIDWDSNDDWDNTWDNPMPAPSPTATFPSKYYKQRGKSKQKQMSGARRQMKPAYTTTTPAFEEDDEEMLRDEDYDKEYMERAHQRRHETLSEENVHVGMMFGSKALIQLLTNPLIGPWTNKIGYTIPMFTGFVVMFLSTLMFAFGSSYGTLWLARALQGIGSACTSTSGMGMVAQAYPDDAERGSAIGIALGGLALGVLVGPPYGGILYQWGGKELPFVLLAILALMDGSLQFLILQPKVDRGEPEGAGLKELAKDPYVIIAAGSITIGNLGIAMLEPSLPLWMMESWGAGSIERGAAFLPASISYLIGTNIFGPLAHRIGRWLSTFIGLVIIGFCLLAIPSAGSVGGLILPNFFMGFSIGMIDASMFPMMGYIVDLRHVGVYGSIYAIADAAFCFAFALGPFFSGPLVRALGFPAMMYIIALVNFAYAPLMFFLRKLPERLPEKPTSTDTNGTTNGQQQAIASQNGNATADASRNTAYYQKIDGITDPTVAIKPGANYQYDITSVWDD